MSKVYTRFQTKAVQKPWGGTYLYIGEYSPEGLGEKSNFTFQPMSSNLDSWILEFFAFGMRNSLLKDPESRERWESGIQVTLTRIRNPISGIEVKRIGHVAGRSARAGLKLKTY